MGIRRKRDEPQIRVVAVVRDPHGGPFVVALTYKLPRGAILAPSIRPPVREYRIHGAALLVDAADDLARLLEAAGRTETKVGVELSVSVPPEAWVDLVRHDPNLEPLKARAEEAAREEDDTVGGLREALEAVRYPSKTDGELRGFMPHHVDAILKGLVAYARRKGGA